MKNFRKIQMKIPLNEKVYKDLKAKIINSEFEPGESLNIKKLTKIFKSSRTPIKEAINRLEKEGLIKNFNYKGAFINILTIKEINEIFQIRSSLELLAIRLAIDNLKEDELNEFEERFIRLGQEVGDEAYQNKFVELLMEFHRFIQKATQNVLLCNIMDNLYNRIETTKNFVLKSPPKSKQNKLRIISAHIKLIHALKQKDVDKAQNAMNEHINQALDNMLIFFR